ncbi:MAG: hypothetical protein IPL79_16670 [Myxococcales bacterium]|nr:hypothetical protein [Myxococcales bacterium]
MKFPRWMSWFDVGAIVIMVTLPFMPGSVHYAESGALAAFRGTTDSAEVRWRVVMAQARNEVKPTAGHTVQLVGALTSASYGDWAVDEAHRGVAAAQAVSRNEWREAFAVSEAYADRLEPLPALAWAQRAQALCAAAAGATGVGSQPGDSSEASLMAAGICPTSWGPRLSEYIRAFEAGVASGIDPRRNPNGFRAAGESALRVIRPAAQ